VAKQKSARGQSTRSEVVYGDRERHAPETPPFALEAEWRLDHAAIGGADFQGHVDNRGRFMQIL
jgi:hypothetical protein